MADHFSTGHGQHHGSPEPPGMPEELASTHTVLWVWLSGIAARYSVVTVMVFGHRVTSTVAVMNGWMVQR
ncbi:hypothetical protein GCM10010521_64140 [Streptomyces rameus]|uniref:Uncharacterized protein n=1 Tax=Streptomyces rameus TaxID=68261 RepID=A0ABN3V3D1_9ACTN